MTISKQLLPPLVLGAMLAALPAQTLELDVVGGSMPGELTMTVYPGSYPFEFVMIVPSTTSGPTPLQILDPADFRSLDIGLELLGNAWLVPVGLDLIGSQQIPFGSQPALVDVPLFFQAVTFQWLPTIVDRISNSNAVRLGGAGTFRDRNVNMAEQRAFATALLRPDRKTLVVGGSRGQLLAQVATDTTEVFDPVTDTFGYGPSMTTPRSLHVMIELQDGRFLFAGGVNAGNDPQSSCEIYDPATDAFTVCASMNVPRMGHTATLLADGRVFVSGGLEALSVTPTQLSAIRDAVDSTEIYDPIADTWTPAATMSDPRAAHIALARPDGKILLCGGISWDPNFLFGWVPAVRTSCDLYDPANNTMVAGPSMSAARALADPVDLGGGRWLVAGGMNGLSIIPWNPGNPTTAAEIYDATLNTWTTVGSLVTARANHKVWSLGNGQFVLVGGGAGSILAPTPLSDSEVFDVATNTFSPGPSLTTSRAGAGIFFTPQGQVQLFGGASTSSSITTTTEWYYF